MSIDIKIYTTLMDTAAASVGNGLHKNERLEPVGSFDKGVAHQKLRIAQRACSYFLGGLQ